MKNQLESALGRELTEIEARNIAWLQGQERETIAVFEGLFAAMFAAGQVDANAAHEAMGRGTARD